MAQFRLRLIIPNNDERISLNSLNNQETFLGTIITDFNDQLDNYNTNKDLFNSLPKQTATTADKSKSFSYAHTAAYTYDEKLSLHQNAQKELTFSIDDKIFLNDEWVENPIARLLRVGTQLELIDKYNNCILFTVSKVGYTFNNISLTYKITCQDSFTYQLTRQNQGYVLKNDETSTDFIGALDIDQWSEKIITDCYLTYEYVYLNQGICLDDQGILYTFNGIGDDIEYPADLKLNNIKKIIKPIYYKEDFPEYYETIPFSVSGSNALAALISLGESLGLQLNVVEGLMTADDKTAIKYRRLFYFGPTKNSDASNLAYSPLRDVQTFSLDFSGDALTTVLNVKSTTWENEEIGLLPAMPHFFMSYILTNSAWNQSVYYPGYFIDLVKGVKYSDDSAFDFVNSFSKESVSNDYTVFIPINRNVIKSWPTEYNQIALDWDKDHFTQFSYNGELFSSKHYDMGIAVQKENISDDVFSLKVLYNNARENTEDPIDLDFGPIYPLDTETSSIKSNLTEYKYDFVFGDNQYRYTIIRVQDILYVYLLKLIEPGLYEYYDDYDVPQPVTDALADVILPSEYQNHDQDDGVYTYYPVYTDIPSYIINGYNQEDSPTSVYFYIKHTNINDPTPEGSLALTVNKTFIRLTRKYTKEEVDFAEIADTCPWLENKLIDFSYFLNLGIISKAEYENLIYFVTNDLRIINGQLMCYATAYYQSLHEQVKILAQLQADIDKLGATFYADVVEPFAKGGTSRLNTGDFVSTYNALFNLTRESDAREPILGLNNIISDYFNKYFNAEQRFLKNVYNFKKFFEAKNVFSLNKENLLQEVEYSVSAQVLNSQPGTYTQVGFNKSLEWSRLTSDSPIIISKDGKRYTNSELYQWKNGHYVVQKVPNIDNYKEFYVPVIQANSPYILGQITKYNPKNNYYFRADYFSLIASEEEREHLSEAGYLTKHFETITKNGCLYVHLDYSHIVRWFLYNNPDKYYIRDTQKKVPFDWVRCNVDTIKDNISIKLWSGLENLSKLLYSKLNQNNNLENTLYNTFWSFYKLLMPIEAIYVEDYDIQHTLREDGQGYNWTINDENHHPYRIDNDGNSLVFYKYDLAKQAYSTTPTAYDDLYMAFYQVPFINYRDSLSTLFDEENASNLSIVDLFRVSEQLKSWSKTANYHTKMRKYDWNAFWNNTATTNAAIILPVDKDWNSPWYVSWVSADKTEYPLGYYYVYGNQWEKHIDSQYKNGSAPTDWTTDGYQLGQYSKFYTGDCTWVNYTKAATAEKEIEELTLSLINSGLLTALRRNQSSYEGKFFWKHYDNYYSRIVATYATGSAPNHSSSSDLIDNYFNSTIVTGANRSYKNYAYNQRQYHSPGTDTITEDFFWINNKYASFCTKETIVNPNDTYVWVKAQVTENGNTYNYINFSGTPIKPTLGTRFSAIKFYPLVEGKESINFNAYYTSEELSTKDYTLETILNDMQTHTGTTCHFVQSNPYLVQVGNVKYCILHLEPYEKGLINTSSTLYYNPNNYTISFQEMKSTDAIYSCTTDKKLGSKDIDIEYKYYDEELEEDITNIFCILNDQDSQLVKVADLDNPISKWNSDSTHWYIDDDLNSRTYTLNQVLNDTSISYYYLKNSTQHAAELVTNNPQVTFDKNFVLYINSYTITDDKMVLMDDLQEKRPVQAIGFTNLDTSTNQNELYLNDGTILVTITRSVKESFNIASMTNGEFWHTFHNRIDIPNLLEKVIVIETQLQNYWNQAYTASQYCQWFLPPSWLPETENKINYFASMLYYNQEQNHITLSNVLLPDVEIYSDHGETLLPAYIYHYIGDHSITPGDTFIEDTTYLRNNPAILNSINHILQEESSGYKQNIYNFTAQENGKTTYYYRTSGGIQYKEVLHKLNNLEALYPKFDGLYVMQLQILLTQYVESAATEYEQTLDNKLQLWKNLYSRFPGIFLENTYENKDARSSEQLLQLAQLAFKDYTSPEKQYNITLIDATSLDGYQGQELHIGDGILLKSSDYYDAVDETYRALNQYLFITDISYNLRQDTSISLTVNTIKYQDKLLQSIVKLIR